MSFASPVFLLALLLVPAAVAAYVWWQWRRERATEAFAARPVMPSVAPVRPGWRRHLPATVYALALGVLLAALARPEATVAVDKEQASVMLATDISGSMQATDVAPNRLDAARAAAARFLDEVPDDVRVGAVAFNHTTRGLSAPTTDRGELRTALRALEPSGGTATGDALAAAIKPLARSGGAGSDRPPAAVVLLSDGASTSGRDPLAVAEEARRAGVPVYTVALGTPGGTIPSPDGSGREPVPPDAATLERIASTTGGESFTALDGDGLAEVYDRLGSQVAQEQEQREMTAAFAGGGVVLLLAGSAMSLHMFRRLP